LKISSSSLVLASRSSLTHVVPISSPLQKALSPTREGLLERVA
jgi:hypothetical protein